VICAFACMVLQTVLIPFVFDGMGGFFYGRTVDFFLLFLIYFSFNRSFFNGLFCILGLALLESALGYTWAGVHLSLFMVLFLLIQALKVQFIFSQKRTIIMSVFCLCLFEHVLHYSIGTSLSFLDMWRFDGLGVLFSSLMHALLAPIIFKMLSLWDQTHVYGFEKQRTLFQGQIKSL